MRKKILKAAKAIKAFAFGVPKPFAVSIDTTFRCNLKCKHCYFREQGYKEELSIEGWIKRLKELKREYNIIHATWVGGEPLLREDLIEKAKDLFLINWIVTNGTFKLPDWKDVIFFISVDGPRKIHNKIRGKEVYEKIKANAERPELKVYIGSVINKMNRRYLEEFVEEWSNTAVKGINFDFYTPIKGQEGLWLNFEERDKVIEKLKELKKEYGDFILLTDRVLELLRSENCKDVTRNCFTEEYTVNLDPLGKVKGSCVMGQEADCEKCGCIVPFVGKAFLEKDLETLRLLSKLS